MADLGGFNPNDYTPSCSPTPVPAGKYEAAIIDSQLKQTRNGQGQYLELTLQVISGRHSGRQVWDRLNIHNASRQAQQIARERLSAICAAVGVAHLQDSVDLHNLPLVIDVVQETRNDNGGIASRVRSYEPRQDTPPAAVQAPPPQPQAPVAGQAAPQPQAAQADSAAPWS